VSVVAVSRALISVWDKTGLLPFARRLVEADVEIVSSGGTARVLEDARIPVTRVAEVTGAPEILSGRVKTLHPKIHGGILADMGEASHQTELVANDIAPFQLVVANLYPFEQTVAAADVTEAEAIEKIDIGGPAMVRAAAKNHAWVGIVTDPAQRSRPRDSPQNFVAGWRLLHSSEPRPTTPRSSTGSRGMLSFPRGSCLHCRGATSCATARTRSKLPPSTGPPEQAAGGDVPNRFRARRCRSTTTPTSRQPGG